MGKAHLNQAIVSHLVELKAEEQPDREVLIFEDGAGGEERLTYADLYTRSNKVARLLLDHGLAKGEAFAVFMRNHPEFVYGLLAAPLTGTVMVPVDPRSRGARLRYLLSHSGAKAVLVSGELLPALEEVLPELSDLRLVAVAWRPEQGPTPAARHVSLTAALEASAWGVVPQQIMDVRHPMQIIYTSGTTGDPKGVLIRNNRFGLFTIATKLVWKYRPDDVLYTGLSLTHGNAQAVTLFPAIATGTRAVISPRFTKSGIWGICRRYGCTSFSLLGGMMAGIFNEPPRDDDADNPVQVVISAGTPPAIWEAFEKRFQVRILEWYGAVEGGFAFKPPGQGPVGSFGKPLPGMMEFRVVDAADRPVPDGAAGELVVRMLRGETKVDYLGNPEASREKTRGGWLRTGDMVHRDAAGWYFFDYRRGTELRRAGDFIQPDRVERVIGADPQVSEVCVYGIPAASGAPGESDLVAAVAPFAGAVVDPAAIFARCRRELEPNCVPSFLQVVEEIPKTVSEKALDRLLREAFAADRPGVHAQEDYR